MNIYILMDKACSPKSDGTNELILHSAMALTEENRAMPVRRTNNNAMEMLCTTADHYLCLTVKFHIFTQQIQYEIHATSLFNFV